MEEWLEIQDLVDRIEELLDMGLCEDALALLEQYAIFYQDEWEIYFLYSRVYMEQNNPRAAIPHLFKSLQLDKKTSISCSVFFTLTPSSTSLKKRSNIFCERKNTIPIPRPCSAP